MESRGILSRLELGVRWGAKLVRPLLELPVVLFSEAICAWLVLPVEIHTVGRCRQSRDPMLLQTAAAA